MRSRFPTCVRPWNSRLTVALLAAAAALAVGACAPERPDAKQPGADRALSLVQEPLALLRPDGGETWPPGGTVIIEWIPSADAGPRVTLSLLRNGAALRSIARDTPNDGSHTWVVPATVPVGADYAVRVEGGGAADVSDGAFAVGPPAVADYFPLTPGRTWTYDAGPGQTVRTTLLPEPVEVNGALTRVLAEDTGRREQYSVEERGLFLHRLYLPEEDQTLTFQPPLQLAPAALALGAGVRSAGTMLNVTGAEPPQPVPYAAVARVEAFPMVKVPAGRYATAKIGGLLILDGDGRILFNLWLAPGVGQVQHTGDRTLALVSAPDFSESAAPAPATTPPPPGP